MRVFHVFLETILCDHLDHRASISISQRPIRSLCVADDIDLMIANPNIAFYDFFNRPKDSLKEYWIETITDNTKDIVDGNGSADI